jgi:2-C-methyl-D-erythritol 4-phosphate cytidylyltransferase
MTNHAVVFGGGIGQRFGDLQTPKQFKEVDGKPIYIETLLRLEQARAVEEVVLVLPHQYISVAEAQIKSFAITKVSQIVAGGQTSLESRSKGLSAISEQQSGTVIFHDAVRPIVDIEDIDETFSLLEAHDIVVNIARITSTPIALGDREKTVTVLSRDRTFLASSPQGATLAVAREAFSAKDVPADCQIDLVSLATFLGLPVHIRYLKGPDFKLTHPSDWQILLALQDRFSGSASHDS